jgi:hypothetical protein
MNGPATWLTQRVLAAAVLLLVVAGTARLLDWLIAPLWPWLLTTVALLGLYLVMFGWLRRR